MKKSMGLNLILLPFLSILISMAEPMYGWEFLLLVGCLSIGCVLFTSK